METKFGVTCNLVIFLTLFDSVSELGVCSIKCYCYQDEGPNYVSVVSHRIYSLIGEYFGPLNIADTCILYILFNIRMYKFSTTMIMLR